jgi:hypothetical protein
LLAPAVTAAPRPALADEQERVSGQRGVVHDAARTGWSTRKFVKTARRYRTIEIQAGRQAITAADPIPDDLRQAIDAINRPN